MDARAGLIECVTCGLEPSLQEQEERWSFRTEREIW